MLKRLIREHKKTLSPRLLRTVSVREAVLLESLNFHFLRYCVTCEALKRHNDPVKGNPQLLNNRHLLF